MIESPIEWHPDADFFRVVCRLGGLGPDGLDPDTKPDLTARAGTVAISSTAPRSILVKTEADGHDRIIGYSGDIYNVDAATGELIAADGTVGLQLLSPNSDRVRPQGYPYRATIKLGVGGPSTSVTFDATPTHPDGTVDLARLVVEPIMDGMTPTTVAQQLAAMQAQIDGFGAVDPALIAAEVEDYLTANPLDADPAGTAASAVTAHELAADPHPQYVTAPDLSALLTTAAAPELIRDTMGTALVAGANVTITPDDAGDTITIAATGGGGGAAPPAYVSLSGDAQTATANTLREYLWTHEYEDAHDFHSTTTNPGRITIPAGLDGLYLITVKMSFTTTSSVQTWRAAQLVLNSNVILVDTGTNKRADESSTNPTDVQLVATARLVAGDYLRVNTWAADAVTVGGTLTQTKRCTFSMVRLG